jgi:hypothetical protein
MRRDGVMVARIDARWSYCGLPAVRMENRHMTVEVLPETGAKIFRLIDKAADRNVLWENDRIRPHQAQLFQSIDDHWSGGWDEAFPTGAPSTDRYGEASPYLGELWSARWDWRVVEPPADAGPGAVALETTVAAPITPARFTRRITLRGDAPVMDLHYRLEHIGTLPLDFLWGTHASVAISDAHRFDVPATDGEVDDSKGGALGSLGDRYRWPLLSLPDDSVVDIRQAPGRDLGSLALHRLTGLTAGWAACTDTSIRRGFGLVFDTSVFPVVFLWIVGGAWRGYHHAAMEAWTGAPMDLAQAIAGGGARTLQPGGSLETEVHGVLYGGVAAVSDLRADGTVVGSAVPDSPA